jgi:uncharacterized membrane protein YcaP (DUF421 family)
MSVPALQLAARAIIMYLALLIGLRMFGKREVGQFTLFDLVLVLLVANAMQPAVTGTDTSIGGGLVITLALFAVNFVVARLRHDSPFIRRLTQGRATVIARDGRWIRSAMRQEGLEWEDADMALREHGLETVENVSLAVLETDGTISVVPQGADVRRSKRPVPLREI